MSDGQKKIVGALLVGTALVAGALLWRSHQQTQNTLSQDVVIVTDAPARNQIETLDKNNDGVPDWQEALITTKPLKIETTTDYTPSDTLTDAFALEFFQDIVHSKNSGSFSASPDEIATNAAHSLVNGTTDVLLTAKDIITIEDNTPKSLAQYGESIAAIIQIYSDENGINEAKILNDAIRSQNKDDLKQLDSNISIYENILRDTKLLAVPSSMSSDHLNLLNSYVAILTDIKSMRGVFEDPMDTLLRMKRYQDDASGLYLSIGNLYTNLISKGAQWKDTSIVYSLIAISSEN